MSLLPGNLVTGGISVKGDVVLLAIMDMPDCIANHINHSHFRYMTNEH